MRNIEYCRRKRLKLYSGCISILQFLLELYRRYYFIALFGKIWYNIQLIKERDEDLYGKCYAR